MSYLDGDDWNTHEKLDSLSRMLDDKFLKLKTLLEAYILKKQNEFFYVLIGTQDLKQMKTKKTQLSLPMVQMMVQAAWVFY